MSERFTIENGYYNAKSRPMIYDDEGLDDYYFCGDLKDFKDLCKLLNELDEENRKYKKVVNKILDDLPLNDNLRKTIIKMLTGD